MWEKKRDLMGRYDSTADVYDSRYRKIQKNKIRTLQKHWGKARCILDVGCGTGLLLNEILETRRMIVGVDFSSEMLKKAMERSNEAFLVSADADNLPFQDGSFEVVISLTLLQNLPTPKKTIQEMARVVKRKGKVIVTALEKKYSADEVENWMISANLKPLQVGKIPDGEDVFCVGRCVK